ncbi:MAG: polysaccharide deacetylase family protein [Patescibacteria group bacterium]
MVNTKLAFFIHFYQPPTQKREIVAQIAEESYIPVAEGLLKNKKSKITVNITGSLLILLDKYGYSRAIEMYRKLIEKGNIEIVGSSAYHAFLPRLPEKQVIRQIELQEQILKKYFGQNLKLRGFFPPEMAFVPNLSKIVQARGYEWIVLDKYAKRGPRTYAPLYRDKDGLIYFFRNREASFAIVQNKIKTPKDLHEYFEMNARPAAYRVIAMDGETFGHHNKKGEKLLEDLYSCKEFELSTLSGILDMDLEVSVINPRKSSWTILDKKRSLNKPFLRWFDRENEIHRMQWRLTKMAYEAKHNERSMKKLDAALFSCQYWWACARPWWHIEMIESGAHALIESIIESNDTAIYKEKALELYHGIVATSFSWMRTGKMQKRVDQEHEYLQHLKDRSSQKQSANW